MECPSGIQPQAANLYSTLPESVLQPSNQISSTADTAKELYFAPSPAFDIQGKEVFEPVQKQPSLTRWPFLLLFGILITVIAGLVGGLIGKAIESNKYNDSKADKPPTPTSSANSTSSDGIVIPKTGCPDTSGRTFQTSVSNATYKLFCNVNWVGNDIVSILASSISDCTEACDTVNQYGEIDKKCLDAAFVPAFMNRTLALQQVGRPRDYFLKYAASGYPATTAPEEIVVICLEGKCPQG